MAGMNYRVTLTLKSYGTCCLVLYEALPGSGPTDSPYSVTKFSKLDGTEGDEC